MKILMNFADYMHTPERKAQNTWGATGYYRIFRPAQEIKDHEVKVIGKEISTFGNNLEEQWDNLFKEWDVYWVTYFSDPHAAAAIFYHRDKYNKKVIIDLDDNYFDIPESNLLYDKFKRGAKDRAFLSTSLSFADAVTVSTEPLRDRVKDHIKEVHGIDKPVYVIPNYNDTSFWNYNPTSKNKDKIVIGYAGSNSHHEDIKMVLPHIYEIMKKYPQVHLELMGVTSIPDILSYTKSFKQEVRDRMALLPATPTFKEFPEYLSQQKWDIGIAPLVDTPFTRAKSHIKWMEYSMFKIPTVASRVYPYFMELNGRQTIEDGVTGFLVKDHEWVKTLEKLINDEELRRKVGENAYEFVKKEWQYKDSDINAVVNEMLK